MEVVKKPKTAKSEKPLDSLSIDKAIPNKEKNPAAVLLGRLGGLVGGKARAKKLSPEKRSEIAKKAATARWKKITLFDDQEREYIGAIEKNESTFNYYNRSGRKDVTVLRNKLEEWFFELPETEKKEIKERFKKSFIDVFYEVFLFHFFKSLGFSVKFHPQVPDSNKKPDFLIRKDDLEIYVEAKICKDKSHSEEANDNRISLFYESVAKCNSSNFILTIDSLKLKTNKQPNTKKLIKFIDDRLSRLDPDAVLLSLQQNGLNGMIRIEYLSEEFDIVIKPMPVIPSARGKSKRGIGMFPFETIIGGAEESLQDSINFKAKRYGKLDKPYLICINALSEKTTSGHDIENAIWGSLAISWSENPSNRDEKLIRLADGIFFNEKGKRIQNVSGILVTRVALHNIPNANYWLFKHPCTENELDFDKLGVKYSFIENDLCITHKGDDLDQIFKIDKNWIQD